MSEMLAEFEHEILEHDKIEEVLASNINSDPRSTWWGESM
jgi:hypothetical protein